MKAEKIETNLEQNKVPPAIIMKQFHGDIFVRVTIKCCILVNMHKIESVSKNWDFLFGNEKLK